MQNRTSNQNGKTSPNTDKMEPNDENWKLLKFLCDRIEENKKKEEKENEIKKEKEKQTHPKRKERKPIPKTKGELLKKRKRSQTSSKKRSKLLSRDNLPKLNTNRTRTSYSSDGLHSILHTKAKSQLYTSAINKFNVNSPTRTSTAPPIRTSFRLFKAGNIQHPPPALPVEHQKSHSHSLPHKYTHHHDHNDAQSTSSSEMSSPPNTVLHKEISANTSNRSAASATNPSHNVHFPLDVKDVRSNSTVEYKPHEKTKADDDALPSDHPIMDPVSSLVNLVRRVTQIYTKQTDDEKDVSDQETIAQVYDKYIEFYGRPPVYPDHLRKFSHKFQDVRITYAAAKAYLDSIQAIETVTSPRASDNSQQKLESLRTSRSSVSTPMLSGFDIKNGLNKTEKTMKITLDDIDKDDENGKNDRENLYAFYNLTELELLRRIKTKINSALNNSQDIDSAIHMVWEREYAEMEKRVHRTYLNPVHNRKQLTSSLSFNHHQLKRDTTYKSLKQMSEATDIDDQDHDAAVYLLKTYFPDDEDEDDYLLNYHNKRNLTKIHSTQNSAIHAESGKKLPIKVQQQHIRSMTSGKATKPNLYRRSTSMRNVRQSEALSLYDSMVMRARETKILRKSTKKYNNTQIPIPQFLQPTKSAPTTSQAPVTSPPLQTINSQDDSESDDDKLLHMIHDIHGVYHEPFKLDEEEMNLRNEITPEPPLFDAAFRQLTTTSSMFGDDEQPLSISKQTTLNMSSSSSSSNGDTDTAIIANGHSYHHDHIPNDLLHTMAKYGDKMESWDFDVFEFMDDPAVCGKGLVLCSFYLFRKTGLLDATGIAQANLWRFLEHVEMGYLANPYHNKYHAVDVLLSTHFMFNSCVFKKHMTMWDQFGAYIAAVCHDLGHMGLNNAWYINTAGNLALLYGDESVLENYHIAETFRILNDSKNNWMLPFPSSVRRYLATVIRRTILATDLKVHGTKMIQLQNMVDVFKNIIKTQSIPSEAQHEFIANNITLWRCESIANYASLDNIMLDNFPLFIDNKMNEEWRRDIVVKDLDTDDDDDEHNNDDDIKKPRVVDVDDERIFLLEITIHACDVANPCKPIYIAKEWASRYLKEAFNQGDMERNIGIPVSAGMDKFTSKLPTSQIGFITFIVKRLFLLYSEIVDNSKHCVQIMLQNEQYWIQEKKKMMANKHLKKSVSHLGTINE